MKYALLLSAALLVGAGGVAPVEAQQGIDLVKQAVAAQGGAEALRALKAVAIAAQGQHWEPGQSYQPGGEPRFLGDSAITITWDLSKDAARSAWDRSMKYPAVERLKYTEVVMPDLGMVVNDKGTQPMSGIRVAASLRELERASPVLLLRALDAPQSVSALPDQPLGEVTMPAVAFTDRGTKFVILFDRATHLPTVVRTRDDDHVYGDSNYDLVMDNWSSVGGVQIAHSLSYQLNGMQVQFLAYDQVTANPQIAADAFAIGDQFKLSSGATRRTSPISGCCGACFSAASPTATRSSSRPAAASSWPSSPPTSSRSSAAAPTT